MILEDEFMSKSVLTCLAKRTVDKKKKVLIPDRNI